MGIIGGKLGYHLLKNIAPKQKYKSGEKYHENELNNENLEIFFGNNIYEVIQNKDIIDFGCGKGSQSVEMAMKGAKKVIGIDIQTDMLESAKKLAEKHNVSAKCQFLQNVDTPADILISKDAFEHFRDPADILVRMRRLLKPGGFVLASFGPTWLHPYGGHLFSVFPWSHLIFTENSQIMWRSDFKTDGATSFAEVDGGLNLLTISKFEDIVSKSPFYFEWMETVPIKNITLLKRKIFREFGTSIVRCKLKPRVE